MKIINENEFQEKVKSSSSDISLFIANLYVDSTLEELVGEDTEDHLLIINELANQIAYLVLGLLTNQEFKQNIAELLYLEGSVEIQKAYDAINKFILSKPNETDEGDKKDITDVKLKSPLDIESRSSSLNPITENTISHVDILSEIENPTPSKNTTSQFVKPAVADSTSNPSTPSKNTSSPASKVVPSQTISTAPTNPLDLGGFGINKPNTSNPAQNIANKLGQNLSTPTTSIPKEVYVSKKLDPYKEPFI